jgi:hypothetical protein
MHHAIPVPQPFQTMNQMATNSITEHAPVQDSPPVLNYPPAQTSSAQTRKKKKKQTRILIHLTGIVNVVRVIDLDPYPSIKKWNFFKRCMWAAVHPVVYLDRDLVKLAGRHDTVALLREEGATRK